LEKSITVYQNTLATFIMQFLSAVAVTALLGFTTALPAPQGSAPGSNIIKPTTRSQYEVWTGAVHFNVPNGKIFKNGHTTDITTLLTFDIPADAQGKTCEFHFALDTASTVSGSGQFDVFTSLAPATKDTTTWPQGNLRDQYGGRMKANLGGEATWVDGFPQPGKSFPCPAGLKVAGELVGTGDVDDIEWVAGNGVGAYIKY
jgi:Ubiquitin 3 binding protein But2 C-terminal domain